MDSLSSIPGAVAMLRKLVAMGASPFLCRWPGPGGWTYAAWQDRDGRWFMSAQRGRMHVHWPPMDLSRIDRAALA